MVRYCLYDCLGRCVTMVLNGYIVRILMFASDIKNSYTNTSVIFEIYTNFNVKGEKAT